MLMDGTGGLTDLAGGAALFRKAALRGHGLAQYNLGVMHALGDGVIKDSGEAMAWIEQAINRLPEGEAMTSAKAWREHLRNRMNSREGMIARNRSQELGDAIVRELTAASTGSASRAARSAVRAGMDELGLSPEALQRLGLAPSGAALAAGLGGDVGGSQVGEISAPSRTTAAPVTLPTAPVETALQEWLKAWSDRRADDYLNFYDARFARLGGVDRVTWAKHRRTAIRHPNWVKVKAEQVSTTEMSPEEVVVGFTQVYSASTGHRETTRKSMIWRWSDGHWRIVSEQAIKMAATAVKGVTALPEEPVPAVEPRVLEAKALESKAQREADLAASRAKREAQLASVRAELESKQAAAKAARELQLNAEKAALEAEVSAKQAKRDVEIAAAAARKDEKRLARELLSVAPSGSVAAVSPATSPAPPPVALNTPPLVTPNPAQAAAAVSAPISAPVAASFESAVRDWLKAWGDRQIDAYLAFYAPGFEVPGGQDRTTWAADRRESMTKPAWLKVRADHLKTSVNGESAEARFFQVYVVAPGTVELSNKAMRWVWADGRWQIVQEQSEPHTRKRAGK
jgi:hypothetical protein